MAQGGLSGIMDLHPHHTGRAPPHDIIRRK